MKIKDVFLSVILTAVLCISGNLFAESYGGGSGTAALPYEIRDPNQMNALGVNPADWDKHFKLMANIDMSAFTGTSYNIIGKTISLPFTGTFDGNGHVISNLTYTTTEVVDYLGLFGVTENAALLNLDIENVSFSSQSGLIGGLVGLNFYGSITDCSVTGSISGTDSYVGGLVGANGHWLTDGGGAITSCTAAVSVSGTGTGSFFYYLGGLAGLNNGGTLIACTATGSVNGTGLFAVAGGLVGYNQQGTVTTCTATGPVSGRGHTGGLVGLNADSGSITSCYATGSVSGASYVGGLAGYNSSGSITSSYAIGLVSGTDSFIGGLAGRNNFGSITDCFWNTDTSLQGSSAGGTGKTTAEMRMLSTFPWDFTTVWAICEGTHYPRLQWQIPVGDFACPNGVSVEDLQHFAAQWLMENCSAANHCSGADLDLSDNVDLADFAIFAAHWLEGI